MIYFFFTKSGGGKGALATAMLLPYLENSSKVNMDSGGYFDFLRIPPKKRNKLCQISTLQLNDLLETNFGIPLHCVQSNEALWTKKYGDFVQNYDLPGDKIGLYDEAYETYLPPPYSIVRWDETQKEANSRESSSMDSRVSVWLQLHRKWDLDVLCFSQRSKIVDLNIRDNARIFEIVDRKDKRDKYGFIVSTTWYLHYFPDLSSMERNMSSGKKTFKKTKFTFKGNVYKHFNSQEGREYFEDLARRRGINLRVKYPFVNTAKDLEEYVNANPYRPPDGYKKNQAEKVRKKMKKEKEKDEP